MSGARATIFYGIVVHISTLDRAARAHQTLAASLLALALVTQRRRKGTLRASSPTLEIVPIEVWSLIKGELIDIALEDALESILNELRCDECKADGAKRAAKRAARDVTRTGTSLKTDHLPVHEWRTWKRPDCDSCNERICDRVWEEHETVDKAFAHNLLASYGLVLASRSSSCDKDGRVVDRYLAVGVPVGPTTSTSDKELPYPTLISDCDEESDQTNLATISPALFRINGHERRFRSLIQTYRLSETSTSQLTFSPVTSAEPTDGAPTDGAPTDGARKEGPQWRLWLTQQCFW